MNAHCPHFASGCNFPEGECLGLCLWIGWEGGERPVPALAVVDYRLRGGNGKALVAFADDLRWGHATPPSGGDIVAYRLHENK